MPDRQTILAGLATATNGAFPVAVVWHALLAAALVAVAGGHRISKRWAAALLAAPIASVSAVAAHYQNPFNASVFASVAVALALLAHRAPKSRTATGAPWQSAIGVAMIAFGWLYPHFLRGGALAHVIGAPLGVIPCPTLAAVIGLALLADALDDRAWSWTLAAVSALYALYGALRLGVWIDLALLFGALALMVRASQKRGARLHVVHHAS